MPTPAESGDNAGMGHTPIDRTSISRRAFHRGVLSAGAGLLAARYAPGVPLAPAAVTPDRARPAAPAGVASGDVSADSAIVWSKSDRPARMVVDWSTDASFRDARRVVGPNVLEDTDFTGKLLLTGLPPGQRVAYRVTFQDLSDLTTWSDPAAGAFRTPPAGKGDVLFAWSGDTAGQGFGINPDWGGMRCYEAIRRAEPHFFVHSGDTIYADNPIPPETRLADGSTWKNVTTPAKSKVAETLAEFRGNHAYNLLDDNVRRFNADVGQYVQWDDHETRNNWYPGQFIDDDRYTQVRSASLLAARAARAFREYTPIRFDPADPERVYRSFTWGPSLELFLLDERTYRGPNSPNRQQAAGEATAFMGPGQVAWLKAKLKSSTATWKVICSDMPLSLIVWDGKTDFEAVANADPGAPLGRELEIADLLKFMQAERVRNVIWLTADVHYAAAHYYDPAKAKFTEFDPFWEFVAGPLNAGTFGPGSLDATFGPQVKFNSVELQPPGSPPRPAYGRPPSDGMQFFGTVRLDGKTDALTVALHDLTGRRLWSVELPPRR